MKNILFIHHGSLNGGAPLSMNYTMNALKPFGYKFTVGLVFHNTDTIDFFKKNKNEVINLSWIKIQALWSAFDKPIYNFHAFREWFFVRKNKNTISKKIDNFFYEKNFDLIHLNSVVLFPLAEILLKLNIPFVWHIREAAPKNNRDFRFKKIVKLMLKSNQLIFLSEDEKFSWLGESKHGVVVNNFVDFNTFNTKNINESSIRNKYKLKPNDFGILFLGGFKEHKGPDLLIEALDILVNKKSLKNIKCIMPDTINKNKKTKQNLIKRAYKTYRKITQRKKENYDFNIRMNNLIHEKQLDDNCILLPFTPYTQELFAISNLVVFPAKVPHFARPIIEAGAMEKSVIATNLPILNKLVINNKTGLLSELNAQSISDNIEKLYNNPKLCAKMGENAKIIAKEKYNAEKQILLIKKLYKKALKE